MTQASEVKFTPENEERFKKTIAKYEQIHSALLPTLWIAQEQFGHLSNEVMNYVATRLDMPPVKVYEAVSFYVMYRKKDMGKYCLQVCVNVTCTMMGSDKLYKQIQKDLGLTAGAVTEDGTFSLVPVQCLGSCDTAPVVQVNDDFFEKMTENGLTDLIGKLKKGEYPHELAKSLGVAE